MHGRGAEVERLAAAHHLVERGDRLVHRRVRIEAVHLIKIEVIDAESVQRRLKRMADVLAREAAFVGIVADRQRDLARYHDAVARHAKTLERTAEDLLARAERIEIRGVEEIDAAIERALDQRHRVFFLEHPRPPLLRSERETAERDARNLDAGRAEIDVVHEEVPQGGHSGAYRRVPTRRSDKARVGTPAFPRLRGICPPYIPGDFDAAVTAPSAFTNPAPYSRSLPRAPRCLAVRMRMRRTSLGVRRGLRSISNATTPLTSAAATEVPVVS